MEQFPHPALLAALYAGVAAQLLTYLLFWYRGESEGHRLAESSRLFDLRLTALSALAAGIGFVNGFGSAAFAVAAIVAFLRLDAVLSDRTDLALARLTPDYRALLSVALGTLAGLVATAGRWIDAGSLLAREVGPGESFVYLFVSTVFLATGLFALVRLQSGPLNRLPTSRRLRRAILLQFVATGLFGLLLAFAQRADIEPLNRHLAVVLLAVWLVLASAYALDIYRSAPAHLKEESDHFEKRRKKSAPKKSKPAKKKARPAKKRPRKAKSK